MARPSAYNTSLLSLLYWDSLYGEQEAARNTNVLLLRDGRGARQQSLWLLLIKPHRTGKVISILVLLRQYHLRQDRTTNQNARIPPVVIEQGHHSLKAA